MQSYVFFLCYFYFLPGMHLLNQWTKNTDKTEGIVFGANCKQDTKSTGERRSSLASCRAVNMVCKSVLIKVFLARVPWFGCLVRHRDSVYVLMWNLCLCWSWDDLKACYLAFQCHHHLAAHSVAVSVLEHGVHSSQHLSGGTVCTLTTKYSHTKSAVLVERICLLPVGKTQL